MEMFRRLESIKKAPPRISSEQFLKLLKETPQQKLAREQEAKRLEAEAINRRNEIQGIKDKTFAEGEEKPKISVWPFDVGSVRLSKKDFWRLNKIDSLSLRDYCSTEGARTAFKDDAQTTEIYNKLYDKKAQEASDLFWDGGILLWGLYQLDDRLGFNSDPENPDRSKNIESNQNEASSQACFDYYLNDGKDDDEKHLNKGLESLD